MSLKIFKLRPIVSTMALSESLMNFKIFLPFCNHLFLIKFAEIVFCEIVHMIIDLIMACKYSLMIFPKFQRLYSFFPWKSFFMVRIVSFSNWSSLEKDAKKKKLILHILLSKFLSTYIYKITEFLILSCLPFEALKQIPTILLHFYAPYATAIIQNNFLRNQIFFSAPFSYLQPVYFPIQILPKDLIL